LKRIAALYEIEADIRGQSAADRRAGRQAESKPLVAELRIWFEADCVAWMWATKVRGRNSPNPICYLSDTDIVRASEPQHPVQRSGGEGDLGRLGLFGARSKGIADHAFVSADRRLDLGPQIVAAGLLPGHAAAFGDHPQVTVALCRGDVSRSARYRAGPRRHDDGGIRMTLGNRLANPVLIVEAVGGNGRDGIGDLAEKRLS